MLTGVGAARGRVDYQRLSGFTHSVVKSVMVGYIEIDKARRGDTGLIEVHAVVIATAAAQYVLAGLTSLARITSASQDDITDLTAWLDDLEDQVARAAQQVDELQ
jgi:outer membrane murein-binding lipoprotein Lpp